MKGKIIQRRFDQTNLLDFRPLAKVLRLSTIKLGVSGRVKILVVSSDTKHLIGEFAQTCRAEFGRRNKFRHENTRRTM